ncbi:TIGR02391 family protein [Actinokineospora xionganensis]|uniref:Conserved hypothetical protein CHP02391 domain-containing protein n=1 Tax=Actinokineospora xionganensis TaxID=2684470 RepID=A0ABR7L4H8_9PSEU|nr:TIGR02391 family protein [Actinokineospora xionganensis]MBC6447334.1 hypothetical protein [Actinokineospora xionganensis]
MDIEWAKTRLEEYLVLLGRFSPSTTSTGQFSGGDRSALPALQEREPTVREILKTLDSTLGNFRLEPGRSGNLSDIAGRVRRGLGILADRKEWAIRLAPDVPQLGADQLHPWVWEAARSLWESKHFRLAVQAGFTSVNARLQAKVGRRDASEDKLFQDTFSDDPPKAGQPRLRISGDPQDQTVASKQRGVRLFALGCAWAIRNPATHEDGEWEEQEALEQLAALSVLARMIDQCEVIRVEDE